MLSPYPPPSFEQAYDDFRNRPLDDAQIRANYLEPLLLAAETAARNKNNEAQTWLGYYTYYGKYASTADRKAGIKLLKQASAAGNIKAMRALADIHSVDYQRHEKAIQLYNKAADGGDVTSQARLGEMVVNGWGCDANPEEGWALITELANDGVPSACLVLGEKLFTEATKDPDSPISAINKKAEAFAYFSKGIPEGLVDILDEGVIGRLYFWAGYCLYDGMGITQNMQAGREHVEYARDLDDYEAAEWLKTIDEQSNTGVTGSGVYNPPQSGERESNLPPPPSAFVFTKLEGVIEGPDAKMEEAVGWVEPKKYYSLISDLVRAQTDFNLERKSHAPHFVVTAAPGTGWRYFCRILAEKLREQKYLRNATVIQADIGDILTTNMRLDFIDGALDKIFVAAHSGILIIKDGRKADYSDGAPESRTLEQVLVQKLTEFISHPKNETVVVFYQEQGEEALAMDRLMRKDAELARLFKIRINFDDFTVDELVQLFEADMRKKGFSWDDNVVPTIRAEIERRKTVGDLLYTNVHLVSQLAFDVMLQKASSQSSQTDTKISREDIPLQNKALVKSQEEILEPLEKLTGLDNVKEEIRNLAAILKIRMNQYGPMGARMNAPALHFVFTGPPGTGKTTVARLLGNILYELGYLSKGHVVETDGMSLLGKYWGHTGPIVKEKFDQAEGGILFIDEAYTLGQKDALHKDTYRDEALAKILKFMEDRRGRVVVIIAGYNVEMVQLIESNSGLQSRFTRYIDFENFTPQEMTSIFVEMCERGGYKLDQKAIDKAANYLKELRSADQINSFGNARGVRNMYEKIVGFQARRLITDKISEQEKMKQVIAEDLHFKKLPKVRVGDAQSTEALLKPLNDLIGLDNIKEEIEKLVCLTQARLIRSNHNLPHTPIVLHSIFSGPPGTGKTTVARLFGRVLADLGYLSKGHVVEVAKNNMVGQWLGHTPKIVESKVKEARGGILFVDEAYALNDSKFGHEYGYEALTTLLKFMEDMRDDFIVIAAGYKKEMDEFLKANSGLKSRFPHSLEFKAYTTAQMLSIFKYVCAEYHYTASAGAIEKIHEYLERIDEAQKDRLGNGRLMRNIFEASIAAQARRLIRANVSDIKQLQIFEAGDIAFPRDEETEKKIGFGNH